MPALRLARRVSDDGGQTLRTFRWPYHNLNATRAPTAADDDTQGFTKGSVWVDATNGAAYVCLANPSGAAVWGAATDTATRAAVKFVRAATTANGTLATAFASGQTIDGVVLATGDRILIKDQTAGSSSFTAGPNAAGSGSTVSKPGLNWSNPGNITASDNTYATVNGNLISPATTDWLVADHFGFTIPSTATIVGIKHEWERHCSNFTHDFDHAVSVVKGGAISATDLSSHGAIPAADGTVAVGGSSDLNGETWTPADINATNFGSAYAADVSAAGSVSVDYCQVTVYYTLPTGGPSDNGVYVVTAGAPVRAADADSAAELLSACVAVKKGTVNAHTMWVNTDDTIATLGVSAVNFGLV